MALDDKMIDTGGLRAASDLSSRRFAAVKITGDNLVDLASIGGEGICGILYNSPMAGEAASVVFFGFPKVIAGSGGFSAGDHLVTEADTGKLITYAGSGTVVAIACNSAAAGVFGKVKLLCTA
jgi:hypothetical protein